jgi:DNA invertase Pin-like site-specific DNA recombinase
MGNEKIQAGHRARIAYVYVRQSTPYQVGHHVESQRLQYALVDRAREWAFPDVRVVDEDLGVSGTTSEKRTGFQRLVTEVALGHVGMILAREVSRVARNNADWYHLLDLCGLFDTLIADQDGIYHPRHPNDRMILGLKGTMSEVELTVLKGRMLEGARNKAKRGELVYRLPVGLVCNLDQQIDRHPDQRVQAAVDMVFAKFRETRSARQTLLWFVDEHLTFPSIDYASDDIRWKPPAYTMIHSVLKNPFYAGAYVYGRRAMRTEMKNGRIRTTKGHPLPQDQWKVLIKEHHRGYITWNEYEQNQAVLADNLRRHGQSARGPVLRGTALLAGLLRCRRCGRRLHVQYGGTGGKVPIYSCVGDRTQRGGSYCLSFGGLRVDAAISREMLDVVKPVAVDAACCALDDLHRERDEQQRLLRLELEQAEYEADRAFRQYNRTEPEHRLVVSTLEATWNDRLQQVDTIKRRIAEQQADVRTLTREEKERLLRLGDDLPRVWTAASTTPDMRKRVIRSVIEEVVVDLDRTRAKILLDLHWKGGVHTHVEVRKNKTGEHRFCTDREVVDLVRQLATQLSDGGIAPILNRLGLKTGRGNAWTAQRVCSLRSSQGIVAFDPSTPRSVVTLEQAAAALGIAQQTVRGFIRRGLIAAQQLVPHAPWCIERRELDKLEVQEAAATVARRVHWRRRVSSRQDQPQFFGENQALS